MKKYGLRVLVGLIAFAIGVSAAVIWFFKKPIFDSFPKENQHVENQQNNVQTSPNGKVEIRFVGYGKIKNRSTLIFEVTNQGSKPVTYWSFTKTSIEPWVKFNGIEKPEMRCGVGFKEFILEVGESIKTEAFADSQIIQFLNKEGSFEFGYYFKKDNEKNPIQYWSEPVIITDEKKKEIIKNAPTFLKQIVQ